MDKRCLPVCSALFIAALMQGPEALGFDLQIHGFSDLVGSMSNTDVPLDRIENRGSRLSLDPETDFGLNLSADLGNNLTLFSQLLGSGDDNGQYKVGVDWIFVTYRPTDAFAIRAGRQINPLFLYAEQADVGFTYLWTRLPNEVYSIYPLDSFTGLSAIYTFFLGNLRLKADLFGGAGDVTVGLPGAVILGHADDLKGIEVSLSSDHFKLHAAYISSNPTGTVTSSAPLSSTPAGTVSGTFEEPLDLGTLQLLSGGGNFECMKLMGAAEVIRAQASGTFLSSATGAYVSLGYHVLPWLTPYLMHSWEGNLSGSSFAFMPSPMVSTLETDQHAEVFGLVFKLSPSVLLKNEIMRTQENFQDSTRNFAAITFTASVDLVF
jgi:hypothetical protein